MVTRRRLPTTERRKQIVEAVLRIIGERGLTSLSTSTLAREVGVSTGALFRHFESLDEILRRVVEHVRERVDATFPDETLPPARRLFELARNRVQLIRGNPGMAWVLRSEQASLTLPRDAVERLQQLVGRSKDYLLRAIREGVEEGSFRDDIAPEILLILVMGAIHAVAGMPGVHGVSSEPRPLEADQILRALEKMISPSGSAQSVMSPERKEP